EQAFLEAMQAKAQSYQLDPKLTRAFFAAQMEAAKQIQEDDFRRWRDEKRGRFPDAPDLATQLRPKIDALSGELLTALAAIQPQFKEPEAPELTRRKSAELLSGEGINDEIRATALGPLVQDRP